MERLERSLQFHFAALTAIGGLMMASGEVGLALPTVAVVAAIVSFLAVDVWKLFHLPTPAAYVGMGLVAIYCMGDFLWIKNETQLIAVAELLVWVEAVLLFQRKSARVFEQIGVFCLLELVVAGVFNHAIEFGLLLIPFSIFGLRALVLLQAFTAASAAAASAAAINDGEVIRTTPSDSGGPMASRAMALSRWIVAIFGPAALLVAGVFFYALPRVAGAPGIGQSVGQPTTGFSESMTLEQVGELLQSDALVMRMAMIDQRTGSPYRSREPIYLRGEVLEHYGTNGGTGFWNAPRRYPHLAGGPLPAPYHPPDEDAQRTYDRVEVRIEAQPLTSDSLFAMAPYHAVRADNRLEHQRGQWLLSRSEPLDFWSSGRFEYRFGTHAFHDGRQTRFLRYRESALHVLRNPTDRPQPAPRGTLRASDPGLYQRMLEFDPTHMPSVATEAQKIADALGEITASPYQLAEAFEHYLAAGDRFQYTLNLTEHRDRSIDPIEEFFSNHRRGHCQYFASAMVMMLRSQNIPARIVIGYKTGEYNPIGRHYVIRQLHAHAWVEALIDEQNLPADALLTGQPTSGPVLVRFDPTPRRRLGSDSSSRSDHFYDFAQSLWSNYVLDMSSERQTDQLFGQESSLGTKDPYSQMLSQLKGMIARAGAERFAAGTLAEQDRFSWRGALFGVILVLIMTGLYWIGWPEWIPRVWPSRPNRMRSPASSPVDFYQQLCNLLARVELRRAEGQTPLEFADDAATRLIGEPDRPELTAGELTAGEIPMRALIDLFYRVRYGGASVSDAQTTELVQPSLEQIEGLVHRSLRRDALGQNDPRPARR